MTSKNKILYEKYGFVDTSSTNAETKGFLLMLWLVTRQLFNCEVNTINFRQYTPSGEPPSFNFDRRESRKKLSVWAGFSGNGSSIKGKYLEKMSKMKLLRMYNLNVEADIQNKHCFKISFPYRLQEVTQRLLAVFRDNFVALNENFEWQARSPDLTPLDFFLWDYLKNKMYTTPLRNLQDLRARIIREYNIF